jgi:hypothetical protein
MSTPTVPGSKDWAKLGPKFFPARTTSPPVVGTDEGDTAVTTGGK